jgi:uncharacterized SAM-binding protein YcdF (DUF218 family)
LSSSFIASQVFNHLILSPLIFILLFFIASFFVRWARWLFVLSAILLYFLSTGFASKLILEPLEDEYRKSANISFKPNAIIVLGGGSNASVPDSKMGTVGYKRFVQALSLAKKHDLPLIFAGGGWAENDGVSEAGAAKETADALADSFGFARPTTATLNGGFGVIYDDKSENTLQNAKNSLEIMKQNGIEKPKIILVTSASHMKRAKIIFEKTGFYVVSYAVEFKTKPTKISWMSALPEFDNLDNSFCAIHEYIGILKFFIADKG